MTRAPVRPNFRGRDVSLAGGLVVAVAVTGWSAFLGTTGRAAAVAAGCAGLAGAYDDLRGSADAKGLAGHLGALVRGRVTSGAVKVAALGAGALAAGVLLHGAGGRALLDAVLVAGSANLINLFDLRPGRALKVALLVALPLRAWPVAVPAAVALPFDLRERTMLGDIGANALGAALGVALAASGRALALGATALVVALTLASEAVSFSAVIDRVAALRWLDRLGRLS